MKMMRKTCLLLAGISLIFSADCFAGRTLLLEQDLEKRMPNKTLPRVRINIRAERAPLQPPARHVIYRQPTFKRLESRPLPIPQRTGQAPQIHIHHTLPLDKRVMLAPPTSARFSREMAAPVHHKAHHHVHHKARHHARSHDINSKRIIMQKHTIHSTTIGGRSSTVSIYEPNDGYSYVTIKGRTIPIKGKNAIVTSNINGTYNIDVNGVRTIVGEPSPSTYTLTAQEQQAWEHLQKGIQQIIQSMPNRLAQR
jgi:hypothetical protein